MPALDAFYNKPSFYGETAAHILAVKGEMGLFLQLVSHGADVVNARCYGTFFLDWDCAYTSPANVMYARIL